MGICDKIKTHRRKRGLQSMYIFHSISMADQEIVDRVRKEQHHILSSHAFSSFFLWKSNLGLTIYTEADFFIVKREDGFFFPCGNVEKTRKFLEEVIIPNKNQLLQLCERDVAFLRNSYPGVFSITEDRDESEYIYLKSQQAALERHQFASTRKKIRKVKTTEQLRFEEITAEHKEILLDMTHEWNNQHSEQRGQLYGDTFPALIAIDYFSQLNLSGMLMFAGNVPTAYIVGTGISEDTYDIHFAKCMVKDSGMDLCCKHEFYVRLPEQYQYINREDDMGMKGLREAKTDAHPVCLNRVWKGTPV